jgi:hypothetical protein
LVSAWLFLAAAMLLQGQSTGISGVVTDPAGASGDHGDMIGGYRGMRHGDVLRKDVEKASGERVTPFTLSAVKVALYLDERFTVTDRRRLGWT